MVHCRLQCGVAISDPSTLTLFHLPSPDNATWNPSTVGVTECPHFIGLHLCTNTKRNTHILELVCLDGLSSLPLCCFVLLCCVVLYVIRSFSLFCPNWHYAHGRIPSVSSLPPTNSQGSSIDILALFVSFLFFSSFPFLIRHCTPLHSHFTIAHHSIHLHPPSSPRLVSLPSYSLASSHIPILSNPTVTSIPPNLGSPCFSRWRPFLPPP